MATINPTSRRRPKQGRGGLRINDPDELNESILAAAGELFLENGFDGTSMDAIAAMAMISKRTLYSRYGDKWALFSSAIYDLLGRHPVPLQMLQDDTGEIESILRGLARDLIGSAFRPEHVAIHRVVTFETRRKPEFGRWIDIVRRKPLIRTIATILDLYRDELRVVDLEAAAEQFASLTFDGYLRLASIGIRLSPREIDERAMTAVDLFLAGVCRDRPVANTRPILPRLLLSAGRSARPGPIAVPGTSSPDRTR
jgi:AcrR family transcriptional regulator